MFMEYGIPGSLIAFQARVNKFNGYKVKAEWINTTCDLKKMIKEIVGLNLTSMTFKTQGKQQDVIYGMPIFFLFHFQNTNLYLKALEFLDDKINDLEIVKTKDQNEKDQFVTNMYKYLQVKEICKEKIFYFAFKLESLKFIEEIQEDKKRLIFLKLMLQDSSIYDCSDSFKLIIENKKNELQTVVDEKEKVDK